MGGSLPVAAVCERNECFLCLPAVQLGHGMALAAKGTSSGKEGEMAAAAAFDAALDVAVSLGWAWTEHFCHTNFAKVSKGSGFSLWMDEASRALEVPTRPMHFSTRAASTNGSQLIVIVHVLDSYREGKSGPPQIGRKAY